MVYLLYNRDIKATVWLGKEGNLYVIQRKRLPANVIDNNDKDLGTSIKCPNFCKGFIELWVTIQNLDKFVLFYFV